MASLVRRSLFPFVAASLLCVACHDTSDTAHDSSEQPSEHDGSPRPADVPSAPPTTPAPDPAPDAVPPEEGGLPPADAAELCEGVRRTTWSEADSTALLDGVIAAFADLKRENDALVDERGVGAYVGSSTETWKAIARGDEASAIATLEPHLRPGYDAQEVVRSLAGTSCIGRVYRVFHDVYAALGREDEWTAIERCGRAWQSDGLHVQRALIQSGWRAPALPLITDSVEPPGSAEEVALHRAFLRAADAGSYYEVPLSTSRRLQDFLPSLGSSTPRDTSTFDALRTDTYLAFATLRAAYHVPLVVPGRLVPDDLAPSASAEAWRRARAASEPFVLESHSAREAWDKTNFEIRPLVEVLAETFESTVTYATGTLLFAPNGTFVP